MGAQGTQLIGMSEAARTLGVSVYTIRRLVARGEVVAVNVGARRLVRATEIDRIVERGVGMARRKTTDKNTEVK